MPRLKKPPQDKPSVPIAPLIDAVFLLLIYFMVTSTMKKQEADISFQLPGTVEQDEPLEMPSEEIIEIRSDLQVIVNEYPYDNPGKSRYTELAAMLTRFKESADANQSEAMVTIEPANNVPHKIIVRVMDAVNIAGINGVNFSFSED